MNQKSDCDSLDISNIYVYKLMIYNYKSDSICFDGRINVIINFSYTNVMKVNKTEKSGDKD
jgi:hypothetical protein